MESDSRISVIVEFPDETSTNEMLDRIQLAGLESVQVRHAFHLIPMVSLSIRSDEVQALAEVPFIEEIHLNQELQLLDEPEPHEDYLLAESEDGYVHFDSIVGADQMWAEGYNGTGITIAVLDTGACGSHPDLQDRLIGFKDLINGQDDMDPADGIDAYDDNGHGTASAWNAVGDGTASGGALKGVAPGADLLVIKVLRASGGGSTDVIAQGIEIAVEQDVDVICLGVRGGCVECVNPETMAIEEAIKAGVSVVVVAGNYGPAAQTINVPGAVEKAVTVGASFGAAGVAAFSSAGPILRTSLSPVGYTAKPDVVAPGYMVVAGRGSDAYPGEYPVYNSSQFGANYTQWSGTSVPAPIIAGLIALLTQKHLGLTPIEAKASLMRTATDLGDDPMRQGWGLANVSRASQLLVDSSQNIALMAPRSLPTLPWSSRVLIVGDDRPPQNVTVISRPDFCSSRILILRSQTLSS
jgi:subtilisin family serine protease